MLTDKTRSELVQAAAQARLQAYAPYSNYPVGAALLGKSGRVYTGVNVENAAYPTTMCAERAAVFCAVSQGERSFEAVAVVTKNAGTPCGSCRQVLSEFGLDIIVLIADAGGTIQHETTVGELLPGAFIPSDLQTGM